MKGKVISVLISICLLLPNITILSSATSIPFSDVQATEWYYNDVKLAYEYGLINGISDSEFAPNSNLTYAEAVKLAACMHQKYSTGSVSLENGSPWYQTYVDYCKNNGIISKNYSWQQPATRAGYMEIFAHALPSNALQEINNVPDGSIPDVPMSNPQAEAIYKLYRVGIVQGVDKEYNCNPSAYIKRSEVAAVLTRMMDSSRRVSFTISDVASSDIVIAAPQNIRIVDQESGAVYIQWDSVSEADYYYVYYKEAGENNYWYDTESDGSPLKFYYQSDYSVYYSGLSDNTKYNVIVTAVKNGIESEYSDVLSFTAYTVAAPKNIRIVNESSDAVYIQWDPVENADYYYFYYQQAGDTTYWYDEDETYGGPMRLNYSSNYSVCYYGLDAGKIYNVQVVAVKNGVRSDVSETFTFTKNAISVNRPETTETAITTGTTDETAFGYTFPFYLYSYDGKVYLGKLVTNPYDSESIWNPYCKYGSEYQSDSIWNPYGTYGSEYSSDSAFNPYASTPPKIVDKNGKFFGYLTANEYKTRGYTIVELRQFLINNNQ